MTTAIDSNVFIAFWDASDALNSLAQSALTAAWNRGLLVVAPPVYAELLAFPGRSEPFLEAFLRETGITVEWEIDGAPWRPAGRAFQPYAARRSHQQGSAPRRILADFLIGAPPLRNRYPLPPLHPPPYT